MMYGLLSFWSVRWVYTDSNLTATIHSRSSWGFLPQVAQVKTRRRRIKDVSNLMPRAARAAFIMLSYTIWAISTLILCLFSRIFLSLSQVQHTLLSYFWSQHRVYPHIETARLLSANCSLSHLHQSETVILSATSPMLSADRSVY